MPDTYKSYFQRNLKKVIAKFGDVALLDEIAEANLSSALATKINNKAEASVVATLIGSDTGKSARTIANEELAAQLIPQNAQESLDTLAEIAAWIQAHPGDASAMNAAITALQTKSELGTYDNNGAQTQYATVKAYVEAVIADFITKSDLSGSTTGAGNVVTAVFYNTSTGAITATKGVTAILDSDLVDLTNAEVDALFVEEASGT